MTDKEVLERISEYIATEYRKEKNTKPPADFKWAEAQIFNLYHETRADLLIQIYREIIKLKKEETL